MQICKGLDHLHRVCGIIHTDLKPENILIAGMRGSKAVKCLLSLPALSALRSARGLNAVSPVEAWTARIAAFQDTMTSMNAQQMKKAERKLKSMQDSLAALKLEIQPASPLRGASRLQAHDFQDSEEGWQVVPMSTGKSMQEAEVFRSLEDIHECAEFCRRNFDLCVAL